MTTPNFITVNDEEGGPGKTLNPWYIPGWTWQNRQTTNLPAPLANATGAAPTDMTSLVLNQQYFDVDFDPQGGFLTFMTSEPFTINEGTQSWRITRRYAGTETWPSIDTGTSPWAFSLEGSGRIYIWNGLIQVRLLATDNTGIVTDSGSPLIYHVIEHFPGGQEYDITVPKNTDVATTSIRDLIITGTIEPYKYDPLFPLGTGASITVPDSTVVETPGVQTIVFGSTEYVIADVGAAVAGSDIDVTNIENDEVFFAFIPEGGGDPQSSDFHAGTWVAPGPPYEAQILIGPENGGLNLAVGKYTIYLKVVDFPAVPIINIGTLIIS